MCVLALHTYIHMYTVAVGALMTLLQQTGTAFQCLHGYNLATSLRCFRSLPSRHCGSAWCLSHMARAYHSSERYREAAQLFREVHSIDPHRQDGNGYTHKCFSHLADLYHRIHYLQRTDLDYRYCRNLTWTTVADLSCVYGLIFSILVLHML